MMIMTPIYSKEEADEMDRLMHTVINDYSKLDWFYSLYQKYMKDGMPRPIPNCGTCPSSIGVYFDRLRVWWSNNRGLFE